MFSHSVILFYPSTIYGKLGKDSPRFFLSSLYQLSAVSGHLYLVSEYYSPKYSSNILKGCPLQVPDQLFD